MTHFPPDNYVPAISHVPGIEVYQPSEKDAGEQVVDIKCARCQSPIAYSLTDNGLRCEYCGYYEDLSTPEDGNALAGFFEEVLFKQSGYGWGAQRSDWRCNNCGAHTSTPPEVIAFTCPFCGSQKVIQYDVVENVPRPQGIIPFGLSKQACPALVRAWLGHNWMAPKSLQRLARLADFEPVYLPFWMFDVTAHAIWRAQFKGDGSWHTRPGDMNVVYNGLLFSASTTVSSVLAVKMAEFNLNLSPYDPKYLAGISALTYDVPLSAAWQQTHRYIRREIYQKCLVQSAPSEAGDRRDFRMDVRYTNEHWRYILAPVYIAQYHYKGESYRLLVNGQTGAVSGQQPVAWKKVRFAQAVILLFVLFILANAMLIAARANYAMHTVIAGLLVFFYAGIFLIVSIERKARSLDEL